MICYVAINIRGVPLPSELSGLLLVVLVVVVASSVSSVGVKRESNPRLKLGKLAFYH